MLVLNCEILQSNKAWRCLIVCSIIIFGLLTFLSSSSNDETIMIKLYHKFKYGCRWICETIKFYTLQFWGKGRVRFPSNRFNPTTYFCACPKLGPGFPTSYVMFYFFNFQWFEIRDDCSWRFVDIVVIYSWQTLFKLFFS